MLILESTWYAEECSLHNSFNFSVRLGIFTVKGDSEESMTLYLSLSTNFCSEEGRDNGLR